MCFNYLLLPSIQKWLKKLTSVNSNSVEQNFASFKLCCGLLADLITDVFQHLNGKISNKKI